MLNDFVEPRRRARRRREWDSWPADRVIEEYEALARAIKQYRIASDRALEVRGALRSEPLHDAYGYKRDNVRAKRHADQAREAASRLQFALERIAREMVHSIYRAQRREGKVTQGFHSWLKTQPYTAQLTES